jgi:small subunit ribosomal protein S8
MNMTDPIADMLTHIRNGLSARHPKVEMPSSKLKVELAKILKDEGYLAGYKVAEEARKKVLRINLKYNIDGSPAISRLRRVSRPGRRVYIQHSRIPSVLGGLGHAILTTPQGVMTGSRARKANLGGEYLVEVF